MDVYLVVTGPENLKETFKKLFGLPYEKVQFIKNLKTKKIQRFKTDFKAGDMFLYNVYTTEGKQKLGDISKIIREINNSNDELEIKIKKTGDLFLYDTLTEEGAQQLNDISKRIMDLNDSIDNMGKTIKKSIKK